MNLRSTTKRYVNGLLRQLDLQVVSGGDRALADIRYERVVRQYAATLAATCVPGVDLDEPIIERLIELRGTEIGEAMFLLDALARSLDVAGDICEFGVAQGATSALIAERIRAHDGRRLWLYDSFEGLPAPSDRDHLIDDPLGLGSMGAYAGHMANGEELVRARLASIEFPTERTKIVKGFVTADLEPNKLPDRVAFAYADFDFYEGIRDVLALVHPRLSPGGQIVVDDYQYLSSGVEEAVKEFLANHGDVYDHNVGPTHAGHFVVLSRRS